MTSCGWARCCASATSKRPGAVSIRALTLDLDDTLWPVMPALQRADEAVDAWLRQHHPEVARAWPSTAMRELRARVAAEPPIDTLWEIYFAARNQVVPFPDSLPALERIAARWPLASLTNGNADLERIGIERHFVHHVCARDHGTAKPDPAIFLAAADLLGVAPAQLLHVGDDPQLDMVGAREAGLRTAWINRQGRPWPAGMGPPPELDLPDLTALADWLDARAATG